MEIMTIDSLDGLHGKPRRRGLAGAASDYDVLAAQTAVIARFEIMAEAGQVPQATVDNIRNRVERLDTQLQALVEPAGFNPEDGLTAEVLERAAAANPAGWSAYVSSAHDLYSDVTAIVGREGTYTKLRSAAAFTVGALLGALIVQRLI